MTSRKAFFFSALILACAISSYFLFFDANKIDVEESFEIIEMKPSQVTIAWTSKRSYQGALYYRSLNSEPKLIEESIGSGKQHEITITGLAGETQYTYWLKDASETFHFQTPPSESTPFSFLLSHGDISETVQSAYLNEMPEFLLSLSNEAGKTFTPIRPFIPIYDRYGIDSIYLDSIQVETDEENPNWSLVCGGIHLFVLNDNKLAAMPTFKEESGAHTFGVISLTEDQGKLELAETNLHKCILSHNKLMPEQIISFAILYSSDPFTLNIDNIQYLGISEKDPPFFRIDVDVESTTATCLKSNKRTILKAPPLKSEKRTCVDCRRLADKGSYEESVHAYERFIKNNAGHFQIDDAYFSIASIYDEKLFDFKQALIWYKRIEKEYPNSSLASRATGRIAYFNTYADHDFQPLMQFDFIRKVEFLKVQGDQEIAEQLITKVRNIIEQFPTSTIAPVMQYWIANQYKETLPEQSIQEYKTLLKKHPSYAKKKRVLIEMATTYYNAELYKKSIALNEQALNEYPSDRSVILSQIANAKRNLRRIIYYYLSIFIFSFLSLFCFFYKPIGFPAYRLFSLFLTFFVFTLLFLGGAFMKYEQFTSMTELLLLSCLIPLMTTWILYTTRSLTMKCLKKGKLYALTITSLAVIMLFVSGFYLVVYSINAHYLIIINL